MSIGSQIEELLYDKKISQKQLAEELGISPSTLNGYVRDYREPDAQTLKLFANFFNVTTDYLLEYKTSVRPKNESLSEGETELLYIYRSLKKDQQELLTEQGKLLVKMNNKKGKPFDLTTTENKIG